MWLHQILKKNAKTTFLRFNFIFPNCEVHYPIQYRKSIEFIVVVTVIVVLIFFCSVHCFWFFEIFKINFNNNSGDIHISCDVVFETTTIERVYSLLSKITFEYWRTHTLTTFNSLSTKPSYLHIVHCVYGWQKECTNIKEANKNKKKKTKQNQTNRSYVTNNNNRERESEKKIN